MQLLLIAFAAWLIAQLIKFSLKALNHPPDFKLFYQSGGMPSAHAATAVALSVAALTTQGYQSPVFGLATVFAAIVIYDTLGVRRSSGEQSVVINTLIKLSGNSQMVREVMGHTPKEVFAGIGVGITVALLFTFPDWSDQAAWLVAAPVELERLSYLVFFGGLVLIGIAGRLATIRLRRVAVTRGLINILWWALALPGALGLFASLLQYQTVGGGGWRLWPLAIITSLLITHTVLTVRFYYGLRSRYHEQSEALLKQRRLKRQISKKKRTKKRRK